MGIYWPDTINNRQLLERTGQQPIGIELRKRKWRWIGHTLRRPKDSLTRHGLLWNPQGSRARGRPRMTWRREVETEMKAARKSWCDLEKMAQDRGEWRAFVDGLCSTGS